MYDNRKSLPENDDPAQDCSHPDVTVKQNSRGDRFSTVTTCDDCSAATVEASWKQ